MAVVTVPEESGSGDKTRRILLAVGVVGVLVAVVFAALTIASSSSDQAGAATPEEAYEQLWDSLAREDLVGAAEIVLPGERESMIQPGFDMVDEMKRLEILDPDLDLAAVPGIDFEFENLEFDVEEVTPDLMLVRLRGGVAATTVEPMALPLGPLVLDRLPDGTLPEETERTIESIDPAETGVAVVRRDDRWFVSLWYSVAEAARREAGLPVPDPADAIAARGESSAEDAVEEMVRSMIDLDVRRMLELLPPSEAEALHAYAPLFLDDAEDAAREARRALREFGIEIDLVRLDLSSVERGEDRIVQFHGGELLVTSDVVDVRIEVGNGALSGTALLHNEGVRFDVTIIDECIEIEIRERGEIVDLIRECASGDIEGFINEFLGGELLSEELPDFDIFATTPVLGVSATQENGEWFVSPMGTMLDSQVDVMAAIDQAKLEALIDWMIAQGDDLM